MGPQNTPLPKKPAGCVLIKSVMSEFCTDLFFSTLALPSAQARRAKVGSLGYGLASEFELNFGRYLPALGRGDN